MFWFEASFLAQAGLAKTLGRSTKGLLVVEKVLEGMNLGIPWDASEGIPAKPWGILESGWKPLAALAERETPWELEAFLFVWKALGLLEAFGGVGSPCRSWKSLESR